jgi:hypothetical protein
MVGAAEKGGAAHRDWVHPGPASLVLALGHTFTYHPAPAHIPCGPLTQCYGNAWAAVCAAPDGATLTYVEGYAGDIIPTHHGWVTPDGAAAWDVTWAADGAPREYFGVAWDIGFLAELHAETGVVGVSAFRAPHAAHIKILRCGPPPGAVVG